MSSRFLEIGVLGRAISYLQLGRFDAALPAPRFEQKGQRAASEQCALDRREELRLDFISRTVVVTD